MNNVDYGKIYARYLMNKVMNKLSPSKALKRNKKYGIIKRIDPEIKYGECDITPYLNYGEYNDVIKRFIQIFEEKLPHCSKRNFYNKIRELKITEYEKVYENENEKEGFRIKGIHNDKRGDIRIIIFSKEGKKHLKNILKLMKEDVTSHELLHFSSSMTKGVVILTGFQQFIVGEYSYNVGLNEGYTELLNLRYFSNEREVISYSNQQLIALGIEEIVGREKMETLYFDANLEGLIEELCKYTTKKHILSLFDKIDQCHKYENDNKEKYNALAGEIIAEIANIQSKKNKTLLENNQITEEEFEDKQLKTAFYVRKHILEKEKDEYTFKQYDEQQAKTISKDGYRILKNHFLSLNEINKPYTYEDSLFKKEDIVTYSYVLWHVNSDEKVDLSQIETIKVEHKDRTTYELIPRQNNNPNNHELADMLINRIVKMKNQQVIKK